MRGPLAGRTLDRWDECNLPLYKLLKDTNGQSTEWLSPLSPIQALSLIPLDTSSSVEMKYITPDSKQRLSQHLDKGKACYNKSQVNHEEFNSLHRDVDREIGSIGVGTRGARGAIAPPLFQEQGKIYC